MKKKDPSGATMFAIQLLISNMLDSPLSVGLIDEFDSRNAPGFDFEILIFNREKELTT